MTKILAVMATAVAAPVIVGVGPAHAACATADRFFAIQKANAAVFAANSSCNGLVAQYPSLHADSVRGQYYVNGEGWKDSSYMWQWFRRRRRRRSSAKPSPTV